jgi:putative ATPase
VLRQEPPFTHPFIVMDRWDGYNPDMDLFSQTRNSSAEPLAYRMRPRALDDFVGQEHIVGKGRLLRRAIQADQLSSVIFYGPPGTGKTTLARVIANTTQSRFTSINAVLSGVKELRYEIEQARQRLELHGKKTILFVDEVHRWNKSQQDALLPWVENGTVILIGATTENPYFEVNSALVSRSRIFQLKQLTAPDLMQIARNALSDCERGYGSYRITFEEGALEHIVDIANGDARSLLNALQLAVETTPERFPPPEGTEVLITRSTAEESIQQKVVLYDKEGDYHFDVISAFIKSVRGSDPDAALYWLARMVRAGENPRYIFRRMLISASEDIGMADPAALGIVESAAAAFDRVGLPEGRFHLTQAALYLAAAPKSNSTLGFFDALKAIEEEEESEVPLHLKDGSRDRKGFGHGEGYLYPHAYRDHWVAQQYLPGSLRGKVFYRPSDIGFEREIRRSVERTREAQMAAAAEPAQEVLTFSPPDSSRSLYLQRLVTNRSARLSQLRDWLFSELSVPRHGRILVVRTLNGLLLGESLRMTPEGGVYGITPDAEEYELLTRYLSHMEESQRPVLMHREPERALRELADEGLQFEALIGIDLFSRLKEKEELIAGLASLCSPSGRLAVAQTLVGSSTRLSALIPESEQQLHALLAEAEAVIYGDAANPLVSWSAQDLTDALKRHGFSLLTAVTQVHREKRIITRDDLARWISRSYLPALKQISDVSTAPSAQSLTDSLAALLCSSPVLWESRTLCISAQTAGDDHDGELHGA